ncbi:MAG: HAD-IA family hydrolase [Micavibrio sp.]
MRIFFDLDGVLIGGFHAKEALRKRWDTEIEKDLGLDFDIFQQFFKTRFMDVLIGKADFTGEMTAFLREHGYTHDARTVIDYWHDRDRDFIEPVMGAVKSLARLPDIELYVATNQTRERADYLKNTAGLGAYFKDIYYSARLGCFKTDPAYFAQIEDELGFDPAAEPPLFFDDRAGNIAVAAARGWNAVLVDGPESVTDNPVIRHLLAAQ